jgi:hypothetical protein
MNAHLEVPSISSHFRWLSGADQLGNQLQQYTFGGGDCLGPFPREDVINHHLHGRTELRPGDVLSGVLLGSASFSDTLPARFQHGCILDSELTLWDQFDSPHSVQVALHVDRSANSIDKRRIQKAVTVLPLVKKPLKVNK